MVSTDNGITHMTIKSISEINMGDYVTIKSNQGRFPDAPWTKQVAAVTTTDNMISAHEQDGDQRYYLEMANYLGTTRLVHPILLTETVVHEFSK